jgi:hypothetical protein
MSVLPAGRPLRRYLSDLDDLLGDPRAYLEAGPLPVGPRRMYRLAALFALPGAALLLSCVVAGPPDGERLALGVGLLVGASVWLGWSLMLRGHELVLHADGVEVHYRGTSVWAPWALFNADGSPFVPEGDSPRAGLTLPVAAGAVPFVELRRDGVPVAYGAGVRGPQWRFKGPDEVVLPARYAVTAADLGELLLLLGRRLGRRLPPGTPPPDAYTPQPLDEPTVDPSGWLTVSLTRLTFPPRCCDCGAATRDTLRCPVAPRGDWLLSQLTATAARVLELPVPACLDCQQRIRRREGRAGALGLTVGGVLAAGGLASSPAAVSLPLALLAAAVGALAGFLVGTWLGRDRPVALRRYSATEGTLSLRFRNADYAQALLDALRARAAPPDGRRG